MTHNQKLRYLNKRREAVQTMTKNAAEQYLMHRSTTYKNVSRSIAIATLGDLIHAQ